MKNDPDQSWVYVPGFGRVPTAPGSETSPQEQGAALVALMSHVERMVGEDVVGQAYMLWSLKFGSRVNEIGWDDAMYECVSTVP